MRPMNDAARARRLEAHRKAQRTESRIGCAFLAFWAFCALLSVGTTAVLIWALIRVVLHFT